MRAVAASPATGVAQYLQSVNARFEPLHVFIGEAEMVTNFVDQDVGHDIAQGFFVFGPIVKDRPPVKRDAIGLLPGR